MATSSGGSGIQMNVGELTTLASDVNDLAEALNTMQQYASGDQLTAAHFGNVQTAMDTGNAFLTTVKALATSIAKAQTFATSAHTALLQATKATSATDEQAAESVMNAGQGA
jgi:hypothetical protein